MRSFPVTSSGFENNLEKGPTLYYKRVMKIALADLTYLSNDDAAQTVPLNVAYLAAYLRQEADAPEIEIFKDPLRLYNAVSADPRSYGCLALSNYAWNFNLNRNLMEMVRSKNPAIIAVMGGPNIDASSEEGIESLFDAFPGLDFYVVGEGEQRFAALARAVMESRTNVRRVWERVPETIVGFDRRKRTVLRGRGPDTGHCDCKALPSPYLSGALDAFLDDPRFVPIIETSRGCPYSCAFCCWGSSTNSRVRPFRTETVLAELEYISARTKNPMKSLYIADSNFGILKRDIEIARKLKEINGATGSFRNICIYFNKNTDEDIVAIAGILKDLTDVTMSKQTLNPEVLKIIGRKNIPEGEYGRFYSRLRGMGVSTYCELIYGLPGESLESFLDGLERAYEENIRISVYPLLLITGTRIASKGFRERYRIRSAFRVMPRYTGTYGEIGSAEYEEVIVSHSKFSRADLARVRLVLFFHYLFSEPVFGDLVLFMRGEGLNVAAFMRFLADDRADRPAGLEALLRSLERASAEELVAKEAVKFRFTRAEVNEIREKSVDQNVFHFCKLLSSKGRLESFKGYLSGALERFCASRSPDADREGMGDVIEMCFDRLPDFPHVETGKRVRYPYDLESWMRKGGNLSGFRTGKKLEYALELDEGRLSVFKSLYEESGDAGLSLYRARMTFRVSEPSGVYTYGRTPVG